MTQLEEHFILTALTTTTIEKAPDPEVFIREATAALSVDLPACLLDSLFYLRAWNSYAEAVHRPEGVHVPQMHPLVWSLSPNQVELWDESLEAASHRGWRRIQEFWLLSAGLCGTDAYRRLIAELRDSSPIFRERWLASDKTPADLLRPYGTMSAPHPEAQMFRRIPLTIHLPPTYHLRLYVPINKEGEAALASARSQGPARVSFNKSIHWALDINAL